MKCVVALLLALSVTATFAEARSPRIGDPAPALGLPDLAGKKVDLASFKGKTTVLYFWNNLCGCTEQLIALKNFVASRGGGNLTFVTVNEGQGKNVVESVITANKLPYVALLDKDLAVGKDTFGIKVLPTIYIIDNRGVVREKLIGILDQKRLESMIQKYL